jgi:methionyl-tRNA formyltransferase
MQKISFIYFGSSKFSVTVLNELAKKGLLPSLVVTTPDKPQGRKLILTPNITKKWAMDNNVPFITPSKLDNELEQNLLSICKKDDIKVFVVASYGKIIPKNIIDIPQRKTLNIHPSLLPKYRGATPLQSAIIDNSKDTGVTIMRIDEQMDHGPIIAQTTVKIDEWPIYEIFEENMAKIGSVLLANILPDWISGKIIEKEQDHNSATFTKKISKEDALIDLDGNPETNFRKIQAYHEWPTAYFMHQHNNELIRIKITKAHLENNKLIIDTVIPQGAKEMSYQEFLRGYSK